jgi:hypothetical protein
VRLDDHLTRANLNWLFQTEIESLGNTFPHWSTVVLHYSALHLVDAYLHGNGSDHGATHTERSRTLSDLVRVRRMSVASRDAYLRLAGRSRVARYETDAVTTADFRALVEDFRRIESEVLPRLSLAPFARLPFEPEP